MSERVLFTIRDSAGVVIRTGMCGRDDLVLQAREGETVEEGYAEQIEVPEVVPLPRAKARAVARINAAVGAARTRYITDLPGQDAIYAEKRLEALSYITQEPAQIGEYDYPFLTNEVGVTAPTAYELSQLWLNLSDMWKPMAARIEGVRLDAVYQIETAADVATVDAIVAAALTALEG